MAPGEQDLEQLAILVARRHVEAGEQVARRERAESQASQDGLNESSKADQAQSWKIAGEILLRKRSGTSHGGVTPISPGADSTR